MHDVREVRLPGVGVRHEFTTAGGVRVGVLSHHTGRREVLVYDRQDPDASTTVLHLAPDDCRTLAELLGATQVSEAVAAVQQRIEGLAIDWVIRGTFFLFLSFRIDPQALVEVLAPAALLALVTAAGKLVTGVVATRPLGVGPRGRFRAGTALIARGEFSVVIATLGAGPATGRTSAPWPRPTCS